MVGGIILASANMAPVRFVYLPGLEFLAGRSAEEADIPLALLLLGFLVLGALVAGTGTFVEHLRLRFLVRRNAKVTKALRAENDRLKAELERAEAAAASRAAELAAEQARARRAEEARAEAEAALARTTSVAPDDVAALAPPVGI